MPEVSVAEAKTQFSALVDQALAGESVLITRRGKPVAEIVPVQKIKKAIKLADLRAMTDGEPVFGTNDDDFIRQFRDAERY